MKVHLKYEERGNLRMGCIILERNTGHSTADAPTGLSGGPFSLSSSWSLSIFRKLFTSTLREEKVPNVET